MPPFSKQNPSSMDIEFVQRTYPADRSPDSSDSDSDSIITEAIEYYSQRIDDPELNGMELEEIDSEMYKEQERPLKRKRPNSDSEDDDDEQPASKRLKRHVSSDFKMDIEPLPGTSAWSTQNQRSRDVRPPTTASCGKHFDTLSLSSVCPKQLAQLLCQLARLSVEERRRSFNARIIVPPIPIHDYFEFIDSDDHRPNVDSDGVGRPRIRRRRRPDPVMVDFDEYLVDYMSDSTVDDDDDDDWFRLVIDEEINEMETVG